MKRWFYFLFTVLFFFSCSGTEEDVLDEGDIPNKGEEVEAPIFKLHVTESRKNIFDLSEFVLVSDKMYSMAAVAERYDSVIWDVPKLKSRSVIFKTTYNSTSFTPRWSNCFFLPGEFDTYLVGYKDSKVVYRDTATVAIANECDFLNFNWRDIKEASDISKGYNGEFEHGYNFATFQDIYQDVPSVKLYLTPEGQQDESAFVQRSEKILTEFITTLYSSPTYTLADEELTEEYNKLFTYKQKNALPQCIWLTKTSKIVLLKCYEGIYFDYKVYAEPRDSSLYQWKI